MLDPNSIPHLIEQFWRRRCRRCFVRYRDDQTGIKNQNSIWIFLFLFTTLPGSCHLPGCVLNVKSHTHMSLPAPLLVMLRFIAAFLALASSFGYLFFLSSQSTLMFLYTAATVSALCYFAFCNREFLATATGWWGTVTLSFIALTFTAIKVVTEGIRAQGMAFDISALRCLEIVIFVAMVLESWWRRKQGLHGAT